MKEVVTEDIKKITECFIKNDARIRNGIWKIGENDRVVRKGRAKIEDSYIHWGHHKERDCTVLYDILHDEFGYLPYKCLNCWKVIVSPKTVKQLIRFKDIAMKTGKPGKWGYDTRDYTEGIYKIYIYCDSKNEANSVGIKLIEMGVPREYIKIQNACTEFNMAFGEISKIKLSKEEIEEQKKIEEKFAPVEAPKVPDWVKETIFCKLIRVAEMIGDDTRHEFIETQLHPPVAQYDVEI